MNEELVNKKLKMLQERRSIRRFTEEKVPRSLLLNIIKHACLAPSACNEQAWRFIIVTDSLLKQKIVDAGGSILIAKAPCGILITYDNRTRNIQYRDDIQTVGACIQNLLLAAHAHGLGACWICTLPAKSFLRKIFKIPSHYSPLAYVILGYPCSKSVADMPRKHPVEKIVSDNCFPPQEAGVKKSLIKTCLGRLLVGIYRRIPVSLKKKYINKIIDEKFTKKFEN
jgi:nitroreductase